MDSMNQQMKQLEQYPDLDAGIIKSTKINKVLKAILKLEDIPLESMYNFKDRSSHLLAVWAPALGLDPISAGAEPASSTLPTTNGFSHEKVESEAPTDEPVKTTDAAEAVPESAEAAGSSAEINDAKVEADVSMLDAPEAAGESTLATEEATAAV
jgi:hypothetical protein